MSRSSTIHRLPVELRRSINDALDRGVTIDDLVTLVKTAGQTVSRSAMGRYRIDREQLRQRLAYTREVAKAIGGDLSDQLASDQARLIVELVQTAIFEVAASDEKLDTKAVATLSRAVADFARARANLVDLERRVRKEAANQATEAMTQHGLGKDVTASIRAAIEGHDHA